MTLIKLTAVYDTGLTDGETLAEDADTLRWLANDAVGQINADVKSIDVQVIEESESDTLIELSPYEQWMVKSNLETIRTTSVTPAEQAAILRANGYPKIATAVENLAKS